MINQIIGYDTAQLIGYIGRWSQPIARSRLPITWKAPPPIIPVRHDAAVTYQAVGTVVTNTAGNSATPSWPTHATDDYAILVVVQGRTDNNIDPGAATLTTANGFTAVTSGHKGSTYTDGFLTKYASHITTFECRATSSSMSAPVVAGIASNVIAAYIITFRGAKTSGSAVDVVSSSANNANGTSVIIAGADPSVANTVVLAAVGSTITGATPSVSSWTNSDLTSFTERADTGANGIITSSATGTRTLDTAYGNSTATLSASGTWAGVTLAIKPQPPKALRVIGSPIVKRYPGLLGSPIVRYFDYAPGGGGGSEAAGPAFDAIVAPVTSPSPIDADIPFSVNMLASGSAQTSGSVRVSLSGLNLSGVVTDGLAGWSETGWSLTSGEWHNTLTKASVAVGTTTPTFTATPGSGVTGTLTITTNYGGTNDPETAEASGAGNSREVVIEATFAALVNLTGPLPGAWQVDITAGGAQTNGEVFLEVEMAPASTPAMTTTDLDGWTEDGWQLFPFGTGEPFEYEGPIYWYNRLTRASVPDGTTSPTFNFSSDPIWAGVIVTLRSFKSHFGYELPNTDQVPDGEANSVSTALT